MPQSRHSPVAVGERVDENKLIMEHTAEDQRMHGVLCLFHPCKQVVHKLRNKSGRRCHENALIAAEDAFLTPAEFAGFFHDIFCHQAVVSFQIRDAAGIDLRQLLVSGIGIFDFLDLFLFSQHGPAVDDIPDLTEGKGVCLDPQGGVNGLIRLFFRRWGFASRLLVAVIRPTFSEMDDT